MRVRNQFFAGFAGAALAVSGLAGTQTAEAKTVNEVVHDVATAAGTVGDQATYRFRDQDWGEVFEKTIVGGVTVVTEKSSTSDFAVGDIIRGAFNMHSVTEDVSNEFANFGLGGNNYLFGRYAIEITAITGTVVEFEEDSTDPFGTGDDTMFEFWESATDPFATNPSAANDAGWDLVGVGGHTLWASAGRIHDPLTPDDEWEFDIENNEEGAGGTPSDNIGDWYDAASGSILAEEESHRLSWIKGPDQGLNGHLIDSFTAQWLSSTDFNIKGNTPADNSTNTGIFGSDGTVYANMTVIPTPTAALAGLIGIGFVGFVRRRRDTQEA